MKKIRLYNSLHKQKELVTPATLHNELSLYVCGITPYDFAHIGHARAAVHFDVVYRLLVANGYTVNYVRNITDIDDKIIKKAAELGREPAQIAQVYTDAYLDDMAKLSVLSPTKQPKVSENIPAIITFIEQLIAKKVAYATNGDVYFDISTYKDYGLLAQKNLDEQVAGARIAVNTRKINPGDFALWKRDQSGNYWDSPWGHGRPGWHIECSSFVREYIGDTVDIHGGGIDLLFPHHENERAQSESLTDKTFARYWVHNAHVMLNKEKMSKSTGNFFTLRDIFEQIPDPALLRFYLLQHHYRTPLDFSVERLQALLPAYKKITRLAIGVDERACALNEQHSELLTSLVAALCDDCNTPKFLGLIFGHYQEIYSDHKLREQVVYLLKQILGLSCAQLAEAADQYPAEIIHLLAQRAAARAEKNWAEADRIRDEIIARGYTVTDSKS